MADDALSPERWRRASDLLAQALARPAGERTAFLSAACDDDDELRRDVETLLRVRDTDLARLERALDRTALEATDGWSGRRVGPYRLEERLGRGGMGVVYAARRVDDAYRGRVALKLLRWDFDDEAALHRFHEERRILSGLEHPFIARFVDAGTTDDQRPYFVLELVEGEPIDAFCERRALPLAARLRLFLQVCEAVQAAHRSLVVHRDIKPGNILVTATGVPKLLDFGIAKLLEPDAERDSTPTAAERRPMTPEYASPEQVSGQRVTTATDVYSLGVLLYRLATGEAPYEVPAGPPDEVRRVICEVEPERPSAVVARRAVSATAGGRRRVRRLRRQLADDLDNVVLAALEKDPRRRYRSVDALADDVRRQLDGRPVAARPATWGYRAAKLARRHVRALSAALLAALLLVGVAADRLAQQRLVTRQRDRAERVSRFLVELFEGSDPRRSPGANVLAREVLDRGVRRVEEELGDEPEVQAALLHTLGAVYRRLGLYETSEPLLRRALERRQGALGARHPDVAVTLHELGALCHDRGDFAGAEAFYRQALAIRRVNPGHDPAARAETLSDLAVLQHERGDRVSEEALYREALGVWRAHPEGHALAIAVAANNLALLAHARGDFEQAGRRYREALERLRALRGDEHPDVAQVLNNLAGVREEEGRLAQAEELSRRSLAMRRKLLPAGHPHVGEGAHNLARVLGLRGKLDEAEPLAGEALAIARRASADKGVRTAAYEANLAFLLAERGRAEEAEAALRHALDLAREAVGEAHAEVAKIENALGALRRTRGDLAQAESWSERALEAATRALGEHVTTAACRLGLARARLARGETAAAVELARASAAFLETHLAPGHWRVAEARSVLAASLLASGRTDDARPWLASSCATLEAQRGAAATPTRDACAWLREAHAAGGARRP